MKAAAAVTYLGGSKAIKAKTKLDLDREIRKGLPAASLVEFKARTGFTAQDLAFLLDISPKTMERAITQHARISSAASDRLYRTARILALAEEVLEDPAGARDWLRSPQHGLGGRRPFELLSTDAGAGEVESLLERIEFGFVA